MSNAIYDHFNLIAQQFSDKKAIATDNEILTYNDIRQIAQQSAQQFQELEDPSIVISLQMEDLELYAIFLGILKSEHAYFYIDPNESQAVKQSLLGSLRNKTINKNTCFLVQTSATTQSAKVLALNHEGLLHHIKHFQNTLNITSNDHIGLLSSPKFAASAAAIYGALLSGASFSPFSIKMQSLENLIAWIQSQKISILHLTPSLFRRLATYAPRKALHSIRAIKTGGETLYPADVALFKKKFSKDCILVNGLGMSEVGGNVAHYVITKDTHIPPEFESIPVGKVLDGHEVKIIDNEIIIISKFLSPDVNEVFFTNDLGYFLPDRNLMHIGRKNRLVKRNGLRIDLNLIESILLNCKTINNAAAYFLPLESNYEVLFVAIQLINHNVDTVDSIYEKLREALPEYMIPQALYILDELPLTASGKINHSQVIQEIISLRQNRNIVLPRDNLEKKIVGLWQDILQIKRIGINDDFFALGGNSLHAMEFCTRLKQELNKDLWVKDLILFPTIAKIVTALNNKNQTINYLSVLPLRKNKSFQGTLLFLSGGMMSEKEIQLISELLPFLSLQYNVDVVKINTPPKVSSIEEVAQIFVNEIVKQKYSGQLLLIGECISCILTIHIAKLFTSPVEVLLMNPWHPKLGNSISPYLKLLQQATPPNYVGAVTFFIPEITNNNKIYDWWSTAIGHPCQIKKVPGDSTSYIRHYRNDLAVAINGIL